MKRSVQPPKKKILHNSNGIALFMVMAAISVLAVLVTEFTFISRANRKMAYAGLDQIKAFYLAKSGLKLSLLRLKAFKTVNELINGKDGKGGLPIKIPTHVIDMLWSFPFVYPIPKIGLTGLAKDEITKFEKESGLEGSFSSLITSESSRYNINMILAPFVPPNPAASPSASPSPTPNGTTDPAASPTPSATPAATFNPEAARKSLKDYLTNIFTSKLESDEDFAHDYRYFRLEDLVNQIVDWADWKFENPTGDREAVAPKKAPYYSLTELHMLPLMDDKLYDLFASALTVSLTPGININKMKEPTLKALIPELDKEEIKAFFEFRDSKEENNSFKDSDAFFKYILENFNYFRQDRAELDRFKKELEERNVRIVTQEQSFKITVQATVNQSVKVIEAWVIFEDDKKPTTNPGEPDGSTAEGILTTTGTNKKGSGLRITFLKFI